MSEAMVLAVCNAVVVVCGVLLVWLRQRSMAKEVGQVHKIVNSQQDALLAEISRLETVIKESRAGAERPGPEKK